MHPYQVGSTVPGSTDFIGWGTYRGRGTTGGSTNCPADYSSGWHVYADGRINLQYWCRANYGTLSSSAANQQFKYLYGTCRDGTTRWVLYLNGTEKTCARIDSGTGMLVVGGEVVGTTTSQNLDVDYENLQIKFNSGWAFWGSSNDPCSDDDYVIFEASNTEFWIWNTP